MIRLDARDTALETLDTVEEIGMFLQSPDTSRKADPMMTGKGAKWSSPTQICVSRRAFCDAEKSESSDVPLPEPRVTELQSLLQICKVINHKSVPNLSRP